MNKICVTVAFASPAESAEITLEANDGSTIADVLHMTHKHLPAWLQSTLNVKLDSVSSRVTVGVWGKVRPYAHQLRHGDRVEIYRALQADPKDARRAKVDAAGGADRMKAKC